MGGGGGRGGGKILDWPEGVFPRRAIVSSDCVFPLVRPIGCIGAQNGILCANDIPPESFHRRRFGPKGCSPEGPFDKNRIESEGNHSRKQTSRTRRRKEDTTRRTTKEPKDEPSAKTTKDRLPTTTNPHHTFRPKKSREAFSKRKI